MRIGVFVSETWGNPSSVEEVRLRARQVEAAGLPSGWVPYLPWSLDALGAIQAGLERGDYDMVTSARTWMANRNAPGEIVAASRAGHDDWQPARPCTMCNRCLVAAAKHPVMCLDSTRFDGNTPEARRSSMLESGQAMYTL